MDIAELVLKYVEALVWPAVTLLLVWGLRSHIREAMGRMTRVETPVGSLEFEAEAAAVRDTLTRNPYGAADPARDPGAALPAFGHPQQRRPGTAHPWTPPRTDPEPGRSTGPEPERSTDPGGGPEPSPAPEPERSPTFDPSGWVYGRPPGGEEGTQDRRASYRPARRLGPSRARPGADHWTARFAEARLTATRGLPLPALTRAWTTLAELSERTLADRTGANRPPAPAPMEVVDALERLGLPATITGTQRRLHTLYLWATGTEREVVGVDAALDFVDGCALVADAVRAWGRETERDRSPVGGR
ncbi:hypothetical protein ACWFQ8_14885 [Streptomyces sp. NPDC055254]